MTPPTIARIIRRVLAAYWGFSTIEPSACWTTLRALQAREEGVEVRDVALDETQLAELREDLVVETACVGVGSRVGSALADLAHPDVGRVSEAGVWSEHLGALAEPGAQLLLDGLLRGGLRPAPTGDATGHTVEIADAAAGDPLAVVAVYLDRSVVPKGERWTGHGGSSGEDFRRVSDKFDLRRR
jgi:hypothetical protein